MMNMTKTQLELMHVPIQVMLLHVLRGAISARSLPIAFRFTRSTAITTGTEGDVFLVLVLLAIRESRIHDVLLCFSAIVERLTRCVFVDGVKQSKECTGRSRRVLIIFDQGF
jgi:hypothetical protein